jgi:hypothetical protein
MGFAATPAATGKSAVDRVCPLKLKSHGRQNSAYPKRADQTPIRGRGNWTGADESCIAPSAAGKKKPRSAFGASLVLNRLGPLVG